MPKRQGRPGEDATMATTDLWHYTVDTGHGRASPRSEGA